MSKERTLREQAGAERCPSCGGSHYHSASCIQAQQADHSRCFDHAHQVVDGDELVVSWPCGRTVRLGGNWPGRPLPEHLAAWHAEAAASEARLVLATPPGPFVRWPLADAQRVLALAEAYAAVLQEQDGLLSLDEAKAKARCAQLCLLAERLDGEARIEAPSIPKGAVIVVTDAWMGDEDEPDGKAASLGHLAELAAEFRRVAGHADFTLIRVEAGSDFDVRLLDEEQMREAGWFRSPSYRIPHPEDAAIEAAGFHGYEGCRAHPKCPTPFLCSERGSCPADGRRGIMA